MSSTMVGLFILATVVAFVGVLALVVVVLERAIGNRLKATWNEINCRSVDHPRAGGGAHVAEDVMSSGVGSARSAEAS